MVRCRGAGRSRASCPCSASAQAKNVRMCSAINGTVGLTASIINARARGSIATFTAVFAAPTLISGFREKALTNDNKYNVKGTTHRSGTAAISVERNVVTASIRLEGTRDKASQRNFRRQSGDTTSSTSSTDCLLYT